MENSSRAAGEQNAAVQISLPVEIVGDLQVVHDGVQKLVDVSRRSEKPIPLQSIEHVVFGLTPPFALGFERRPVVLSGLIFDRALGFH